MPPPLLPEELRWSCLRCGRSCHDWSEVGVEAGEVEPLRALVEHDPGLVQTRRTSAAPLLAPGKDRAWRLAFCEDGAGTRCSFLDADGDCSIHARHGEGSKPRACRSFPFLFVDTPDGERLAVSFACTAVLLDHGTPITAQGDAIATLREVATHRERRGRGILLAPGTPLTWRDYRLLREDLMALLAETADVADALVAQARLLREAAMMAQLVLRPSARLFAAALRWLVEHSGEPPRFLPPFDAVAPDDAVLLRRWVRHRLWRDDLLRGDEVILGHALLCAETALACAWSSEQPGGLVEAIRQVERGLSLHADLVERMQRDRAQQQAARRLLHAPRLVASLAEGIRRRGVTKAHPASDDEPCSSRSATARTRVVSRRT